MKYFIKQIRLIYPIAKLTWQRHFEYRLAALVWIINGFIIPLILMGIWLLIRKNNQLPLNDSQIITYYLLTTFVFRVTQSWRGETLGHLIRIGNFSGFLIRPLSYWISEIGHDLGIKMIRLLTLTPFLLIFLKIFENHLSISLQPVNFVFFFIALIMGYLLNFLIQLSVGLSALWVKHNHGVATMYSTIMQILSGLLIPPALMPTFLFKLSEILPFRYLISFPIEIAMGRIAVQSILYGFVGIVFWLAILMKIQSLIFHLGVKRYTAVGI